MKQYKGDENKISHAIQEWWEEEPPKEEEWQDVNKKALKKPEKQNYSRQFKGDRDRGGRDNYRSSGSGRGFYGRGMGGGRGAGAERRSRDYGRDRNGTRDRDRAQPRNNKTENPAPVAAEVVEATKPNEKPIGVPAPVTNVPQPKGAWGQSANSYAGAAATTKEKTEVPAPVEEVRVDVGTVTDHDPTPAGFLDSKSMKSLDPILSPVGDDFAPLPSTSTRPSVPAPPTANVWATKGSAHLIKQEKQKPPPQRQPRTNNANTTTRTSQPNKPHQPQEIISEPINLSAVNNNPIVSHDASEVTSANDVHTSLPSDALDAALESLLPASVNGANVNATGWSPRTDPEGSTAQIPDISIGLDASVPEPALEQPQEIILEEIPKSSVDMPLASAEVEQSAPPATQLPSSTVLLGAWDVSGADDAGLDFGFGSFGNENDVGSVEEKQIEHPQTTNISAHTTEMPKPVTTTTTGMSPARPPPGLSIGGMPPMPANAVPVHELEGKLEGVSLSTKHNEDSSKTDAGSSTAPLSSTNGVGSTLADKNNVANDLSNATQSSQPQPPNLASATHPDSANPMLASQSYGATYGMGIYNYNGAANVGNGFMGIHGPNAQVLAGVIPQQQKLPQQGNTATQQQGSSQSGIPQHLPQGQQQFGAQANNGNTSSDGPTPGSGDNTPTSAGLPPGMPGTMPYNPAMFYGQQYYQMGQPHGGVGYGHGYGQFGAGVQSGFYQQVMQQNGGYGQPYDDSQQQHHGSHNSHHNSSSHQSYQKNNSGSGGYRGRNNHHGNTHHGSHNNQYQNQYNPQHGGYGNQPYNMGYGVDQFGNRSGFVPGNMDPYAMQQNNAGYQSGAGHSSGAFNQDDSDHQLSNKGKAKGGNTRVNSNGFNSGNPNMQQFQQVPPQQQGGQIQQQQGFGLQGGSTETSSTGVGGSSNNGWSNQGWAGGSTWQGN